MRGSSRLTAVAASAALAVSPLLAPVGPAAHAADVPTCFDRPATIVGTEGDDVLDGTPGDDVIVGLGGFDLISGGTGGDDVICAGDNPVVDDGGRFGPQGEQIFGGPGDDLIAGGPGWDEIHGDQGDDTIFTDDVAGTAAASSPVPTRANPICRARDNGVILDPDRQVAYGGPGDDVLTGGRDNEQLWGDQGDDILRGGPGADCLRGDPPLAGPPPHPTEGADVLLGGPGNDELRGGDKNDTLFGGPGADRNLGGAGRDLCASPAAGRATRSCELASPRRT
jgi:Ca2+-binding RTX toxin-like protein